jgi:uncharacterized coiled-coil protein SlyX
MWQVVAREVRTTQALDVVVHASEIRRMENRLVDLEVRYTHLERQLDELSQVVFSQQKLLDRMAKDLSAIRSRVMTRDDDAPDEPPPHY